MKAIAERSLLRYPGSKFRIREWLLPFFPKHKTYTEAFAGTASMLFYKKPSPSEIINDVDKDLVNIFRVLKNITTSTELKRRCLLTPYSRFEYERLFTEQPKDDIDRALQFIFKLSLGQRGKLEKSGFDTRINSDGYAGKVNYIADLPNHFDVFTSRLRKVIIEDIDGVDLIKRYDRENALHFVDPEYLNVKKGYSTKFTTSDHERLKDVLLKCTGYVILCGYPTKEYSKWYETNGWKSFQKKAFADGGFERTETIWLNPACFQAQT